MFHGIYCGKNLTFFVKTTFIKTLLPWICYAGLNFLGFPKSAAPAALLALILGCTVLGSGVKPVDCVIMFYFMALGIGVGLLHCSWLVSFQPVVAPGMLAFMAFGTVLIRRPFTLPYARESEKDSSMWENPHFYRVNYILSVLWGTAFLIAAAAQLWALGKPGMIWPVTLGAFVVTGLTAWFTWWFPPWYRKNYYEPTLTQEEMAR
jgi:hypothetical protein